MFTREASNTNLHISGAFIRQAFIGTSAVYIMLAPLGPLLYLIFSLLIFASTTDNLKCSSTIQ